MKKVFLLSIAVALALGFSSCKKESYDLPDGDIQIPIAVDLGIDINDEGAGLWSNSRCYGFPIRPVYVME